MSVPCTCNAWQRHTRSSVVTCKRRRCFSFYACIIVRRRAAHSAAAARQLPQHTASRAAAAAAAACRVLSPAGWRSHPFEKAPCFVRCPTRSAAATAGLRLRAQLHRPGLARRAASGCSTRRPGRADNTCSPGSAAHGMRAAATSCGCAQLPRAVRRRSSGSAGARAHSVGTCRSQQLRSSTAKFGSPSAQSASASAPASPSWVDPAAQSVRA